MLVLTRKLNEAIVLPGIDASVIVLDIQGDRVRLGIEAPADVRILREELLTREPVEKHRDKSRWILDTLLQSH